MASLQNQENALRLIQEAVQRADQLGSPYNRDLLGGFERAQETLKSATEVKSQLALILSAARILIEKVEKKTIRLIIGDDPITRQQMSHLVRIRLICAELINLLTSMLERANQLAPSTSRL